MIKNRLFRGDFLFLPHEKTSVQDSGQDQQNSIAESGKKTGGYE